MTNQGQATLCDTPENEGCTHTADYAFVCSVEGIQRHLCNYCKDRWRERVRSDAVLAARCPRCIDKIPARPLPRPETGYDGLLGTYMSVAFDRAMHKAGILEPVRARVLKIADTDMTVWAEAEQRGQAQHADT